MATMEYYCGGQKRKIRFQRLFASEDQERARRLRSFKTMQPRRPQHAAPAIAATLMSQAERFSYQFVDMSEETMSLKPAAPGRATVIPTETVVVEASRSAQINWLREKYGMETIKEGSHGKVLLKVPGEHRKRQNVKVAFEASQQLFERGGVAAAHPNFIRVVQRPAISRLGAANQWALENTGQPGVKCADVNATCAWKITTGSDIIRVAVLDEGVDTLHPHLQNAVVAEKDFVDDNIHARPDGNDAHGTACAGIIVSQDDQIKGLAPGVKLVAVRIAKSDQYGYWIYDDFEIADAIDWSWDEAQADVLSNSWGGGPPVDIVTRAFERARTRGRKGKGSVIVVAAGNDQSPVGFPGNLPGVLTVGASNQWDERKTRKSKDGEDWWGSCYGDALDLLAPGVRILTTDISGTSGYSNKDFTDNFNGTSSATPFAAATACLILSVKTDLTEEDVRNIINISADPLGRNRQWSRTEGNGRLNANAALRAAFGY